MFTRLTPSRLLRLLGLAAAIATGVLASARVANAQASVVVLHSFTGSPDDGASPWGGVIQGPDGTLYGTTGEGGPFSRGTIFRIAPDGSGYAILRSFSGSPTDGTGPYSGLLQASDGMLYGTTVEGGPSGFGTIFQIAPDGSGFAVLHNFTGADGATPRDSLIQGPDGTLYGTTPDGGTDGAGAIFRMAPDGSGYAVLHSFAADGSDGIDPKARLLQAADGTLYGTTGEGGPFSRGTIFRIAPDGSGYAVLHSFTGESDGGNPAAGLLQASDGTLYGTTGLGGAFYHGTIFQIAPDGSGLVVLHSFAGSDPGADGAGPDAVLIQGPDGTLYGMTAGGGDSHVGTIFQIAPDGSGYALVHSFSTADGALPIGGLIRGPDGSLYGTTLFGSQRGVVFRLTLSPSAPMTR